MIDYTKLRAALDPDPGGEDTLRLRTAKVQTMNANGTVDILLSGVLVPGVPRLDNGSWLATGANVQVITLRGGHLILGATQKGARRVEALNTANPSGVTSTSYTALTSGDILGVAFIAPPSGAVEVVLEGWLGVQSTNAGSRMWMSAWLSNGSVVNSGSVVSAPDDTRAAVVENPVSVAGYRYGYVHTAYQVTGLTPGNDYNVTMAHKVSNSPTTGGAAFNRRVIVRPI